MLHNMFESVFNFALIENNPSRSYIYQRFVATLNLNSCTEMHVPYLMNYNNHGGPLSFREVPAEFTICLLSLYI